MESARPPRVTEFDLILFGATGFTGRLVAEYLLQRQPRVTVRWALAGRSLDRLEAVRASLAELDPAAAALPLLAGDSADPAAMRALAARARTVCSTVGPYALYGSNLVAACADTGAHYCDLTGEPDWVRRMIDEHHDRARATGARIVPCCGFDSIPSDLGVFTLHRHVSATGRRLAAAHFRLGRASGGFSGGTIASMLALFERLGDPLTRHVIGHAYSLNPEGERSGPDRNDPFSPRRDAASGRWTAPFIMSGINSRVVRRTNALTGFSYGRDFRYDERTDTGPGLRGLATAAALGAGTLAFFSAGVFGPTRRLMEKRLPQPGEGPSRDKREGGHFKIAITGECEGGGEASVVVEGNRDPGYGATSRMLAEAALCLTGDPLPEGGGLLTPASAMGTALLDRLRPAGITFTPEG